jgi:transaldolase/glucose-6-phosphate isomerase
MNANPLRRLESFGQSVWMDVLRRGMFGSGQFDRLIAEDGVTGVTSNPSIFEKAIAGSHDYDEAIRILALQGRSEAEIYQSLTVEDVRTAADRLRTVFDNTGGRDGFVSLEVSPHLAYSTEGTVSEARRLWNAVARPNLMIKVPGTREGLPAIRRLTAEGINVNVTLLFGLPRYREVTEAYLAGLEDFSLRGKPLDSIASVASFFLSRIDVLLDPVLEKIAAGGGEESLIAAALAGQAAVASAKVAYAMYREIFSSDRFRALEAKGARTQRLLWASTGTKNPAYSDVKYVEPLIGPETVNTLPLETITAYRDHGRPADRLAEGVEEARANLERLRQAGVDIDRATQQLEDEGVDKFNKPFDKLMETIRAAREAALREPVDRQAIERNGFGARTEEQLGNFERRRFVLRMWNKDPGLWTEDPQAQQSVRNGLGWLHVAEKMTENLDDLLRFAAEVRRAGIRRVVHLGMGGSSLAPLVFARMFPPGANGLPLTVLDSTDPAAVRAVERGHPAESTLFIVASKSGTTAETAAFGEYFYDRARGKLGERAGGNFVAITDPGTPLELLAVRRGFRRVFRNFADIGGRYSALSYFGVVPAALLGVDVGELLERSLRMANACSAYAPERENPGLQLGAALGGWALAGREKVTFLTPRRYAPLGLWLEQLLAESTGKGGKGLLPVAGEPDGRPAVYGDDRCFVVFLAQDAPDPALERKAAGLEKAGFPVITIRLDDALDIGQEFFRWEVATAAAGAILGINPFDQPNVGESKENTGILLDGFRRTGALPEEKPFAADRPLAFFAGAGGESGREALRRFLGEVRTGDYLAIQAWLPPEPEYDRALQALRKMLRAKYRTATTLGYGPRFLHSTGQYHKGGANTGVFLQLTADPAEDLPIPGEPFTFGLFERAQALGDLQALRRHGRRILRVHLGADPGAGLAKLETLLAGELAAPAARKAGTAAKSGKKKKPAVRRTRKAAGRGKKSPGRRR